jgi:predicted transcriptional regulator of viral defense system
VGGWEAFVTAVRSKRTITTAELIQLAEKHLTVSADYARRRLQHEGVLTRGAEARRGLWLVRAGRKGSGMADSMEAVLSVMGAQTVFAYGTALFLHGLTRYARLSECYVLTTARRNRRRIGAFVVRPVQAPLRESVGLEKRKYGNRSILVTDQERTLIDCIHRPKYAQGWENVVHALTSARKLDVERLIAYVKQYRIPALVAKVGLVLEQYGSTWRVSERSLASLRPYLPRNPVKFARGAGGRFNRRWNLYVPEGVFNE